MLVQCRVLAAAVLKEKMKIERDIAWKRKGQTQNRFGIPHGEEQFLLKCESELENPHESGSCAVF